MRQRKVKDLENKLQAVRLWQVEELTPDVWDQVFPARQRMGRRGLYLEIGCGKGDFLLQQALRHPESDFVGIEGQASVVLRAMEKAQRLAAGAPEEDDPVWMQETRRTEAGRTEAEEPAAREGRGGFPDNVRFACAFVNGLEEFFAPGSLDGVFLNFSDPWPKPRHAKRRLTYRGRLQDYAQALKPGGSIAIKTDNDALFDFTLEEITACGWTPEAMSRDLHGGEAAPAAQQAAGLPDSLDTASREDSPEDNASPAAKQAALLQEARQVMTEYERKFHEAGKPIHYVLVRP